MTRTLSGKLAAASLVLLAVSTSTALAADPTIRPAVYTRATGTPAPTSTLDLPIQIPSTLSLPTQISSTPSVQTVGWRHYGYRPYAYGPYVAYRPYVVAPYVAVRPYYYPAPYYGYAAGVYPGYGAYYRGPGPYYGYRGRYGW